MSGTEIPGYYQTSLTIGCTRYEVKNVCAHTTYVICEGINQHQPTDTR